MQRKHGLVLGLAGLAIVLFVSLSQAQVPSSDIDPCVANWHVLTWEEREHCAEPLGGREAVQETIVVYKQQTSATFPTISQHPIGQLLMPNGMLPGVPRTSPRTCQVSFLMAGPLLSSIKVLWNI